MKTGTLGEYAAHRGVVQSYVTKLKAAGRLVMVEVDGRQRVNFTLSDRLIENTTDQARAQAGRNSPATRAPAASPPAAPAAEPPPAPGSAAMTGEGRQGPAIDATFRRAQTQERVIGAKTAQINYQKLLNEVLDREVVRRTVFDAFRSLRDQAFQSPQRAALRALGKTDVREIERINAEELRRAFDGWEQRFEARLPPLRAEPK